MIKFGLLKLPSERGGTNVTSVYGWLCEGGIIEAFATHPNASGTSDARLGLFHPGDINWGLKRIEEISQARFNAAFLLTVTEDELEDDERTMSLGELMLKYPIEEC